jgi:hypothetical protein
MTKTKSYPAGLMGEITQDRNWRGVLIPPTFLSPLSHLVSRQLPFHAKFIAKIGFQMIPFFS